MISRRVRQNVFFLLVMSVIAIVGVLAAVDVLEHERLPNPFANTYAVNVALTAADGVVPGYGQPVNVAGVPVGVIAGAKVQNGLALIKMAIERGELPHVYRDATADLQPVTPLKDMELDLNPGQPSAGLLGPGATIAVADSTSPGELEDLLGSLDGDTRSFLTSLIGSLGTGTAGQGANLRRLLVALGPTARQVHEISTALAGRRADIASLVHNLAIVTRAASQDGQLGEVVKAGDQTLHAVAEQSSALRQSIVQLPSTLQTTGQALSDATDLARAIDPAARALSPALTALPTTLRALGPFAGGTARALKSEIGPFVRQAVTPVGELAATIPPLSTITPQLINDFKVAAYAANELAYNPGGGDPGFLFWLDWAAHNSDSATSNEDAMGSIARTLVMVSCDQLTSTENAAGLLEAVLGVQSICRGLN
ncbi:MAG TPA: MlaD family protein [Solirubrobacteraceae bacterium]|nr:MlaD family protein [Solirubrobacteraceae bacterium]